ncbi:MAG: M48 family metallopeptidase [Phycisphaerales bacterium]|nr:M48 family metallopeptidase [Phycisphaerales bacterium]
MFGKRTGRTRSAFGSRLAIGGVIAAIAFFSYWRMRSPNPHTGEMQHVAMSTEQEVALGLQAREEMAAQFGGLHPDAQGQETVDRVGQRLVAANALDNLPWQFEFHLLGDEKTINAFALPGGQIFITAALYTRLQTEAQLAGVLGHEIGHVVERHGSEHLAKAQLTQGLVGAVGVGAADGASGGQMAAAAASMVGNMINLKYGRGDELESDSRGVEYMAKAGYDPTAMIHVMQVLAEASGDRGGQPEFFATHPNPENRLDQIRAAIRKLYPQGVPETLEK